MTMAASYDFSTDVEVRFADLDTYGHVNNATYFTYLETARTKLIPEKFVKMLNGGLHFLVAKAECEYRKPIGLADRVVVSMTITRFGNSSFDIDYALHNGNGVTFATAKTVMVCFDKRLGRSTSIPETLRQAFRRQ
jgi:acyl-CoA thioester hydrolase